MTPDTDTRSTLARILDLDQDVAETIEQHVISSTEIAEDANTCISAIARDIRHGRPVDCHYDSPMHVFTAGFVIGRIIERTAEINARDMVAATNGNVMAAIGNVITQETQTED